MVKTKTVAGRKRRKGAIRNNETPATAKPSDSPAAVAARLRGWMDLASADDVQYRAIADLEARELEFTANQKQALVDLSVKSRVRPGRWRRRTAI